MTLKEGEAIYQLGQPADRLFRVASGEVHLFRHDKDGKRMLIKRAYEHDYFAELSLYVDEYLGAAICAKPSVIYCYQTKDFLALLQNDSSFAMEWISHLTLELRRQRANVERLHLKSASDRLVHYLMTEGEPKGELTMKGNLTEMAELLGITRETFYRSLAAMEQQRKLERVGQKLRILPHI